MSTYPILSLLLGLSPMTGPVAPALSPPVVSVPPFTTPSATPSATDTSASATTAVTTAVTTAWGWPLSPRPLVRRRFDAPGVRWAVGHRGVDLAAPVGTQVIAPAAGTVAFAGVVAGRPVLSVDHPGGLRSSYEPVIASVVPGQQVRRGQVLGTVSPQATVLDVGHCAPDACLHWGVRRGEAYVDPLTLVEAVSPVLLPLDGSRR